MMISKLMIIFNIKDELSMGAVWVEGELNKSI